VFLYKVVFFLVAIDGHERSGRRLELLTTFISNSRKPRPAVETALLDRP
jgi:hypothetical protein